MPTSNIALCSIVRTELRWGALRSQNHNKNLAAVEGFIQPLKSFPFDDRAADIHAEVRHLLELQGMRIGPHDMLISAIALANDATLVTHNTSEFQRVPKLKIEDWEQ
jgi:tRNA(fMet)-specific endonuclease VapC